MIEMFKDPEYKVKVSDATIRKGIAGRACTIFKIYGELLKIQIGDKLYALPKDQLKPITKSTIPQCRMCNGQGTVDSGGVTPWGQSIDLPCPMCCDS